MVCARTCARRCAAAAAAGGLGEILEGNDLQNSDIPVKFRENVEHAVVCTMTVDDQSAQLLAYAVSNHYWYQMFVDELPVWGMVRSGSFSFTGCMCVLTHECYL